MRIEEILEQYVESGGVQVKLNTLPFDVQLEFLIENYPYVIGAKESKVWRIENFYHIITKRNTKVKFSLNRAQRHFVMNYLVKGYYRHIILKSRQLGFTTLIMLWMLDEVIFNPNFEGLCIADRQENARNIFDRKVRYALQNLPKPLQDAIHQSKKAAASVGFTFADNSTSKITVALSGRGSTFHMLLVSEFAELCRMFPTRADEVITGAFPSLPFDGIGFIESTAKGMSGHFHSMFMSSWKRRGSFTPALSKIEWVPHFYNWQYDDDEMNQIDVIPVSSMEKCEIDWEEYQRDYELTNKEISYYYAKWVQMGKDADKLREQYPTTVDEAFIGSGSNYFNLKRTAEMLEKCDENYKRYDYINGQFTESKDGDLIVYHEPVPGKRYVIGGDVAEGLTTGDYSVATVVGFDKEIKAIYIGHLEPDDYSKLVRVLGYKYNTALLAVEFNKDGNWVNTDLNINNYPNIYLRTHVDDITKSVTKSFGWLTTRNTRDFALGELKRHFNASIINCKPLLEEMKTFVRNKRGKPEAAPGAHDDVIMATSIAIGVLQGKLDMKEEVKTNSWHDLVFFKG